MVVVVVVVGDWKGLLAVSHIAVLRLGCPVTCKNADPQALPWVLLI